MKFPEARSPPAHVYAVGALPDTAAIAGPPESTSAAAAATVPRTPSFNAFPMGTNPFSHGPPKGPNGSPFHPTPAV